MALDISITIKDPENETDIISDYFINPDKLPKLYTKHVTFYVQDFGKWTQEKYIRVNNNFYDAIDLAVRASGHELALILSRFDNIPAVSAPSCIWRGEFARFICDNIVCLFD